MSGLPLQGANETHLDQEPEASREGLRQALDATDEGPLQLGRRLRRLVRENPKFLNGWAYLSEWALEEGDAVAAYAFARTGYHRGLDKIRAAGWRGSGAVPWSHEPNQGFLRSVFALMRSAAAIGEMDEAQRCRQFLLDLDPQDHQHVAAIDVESLHR